MAQRIIGIVGRHENNALLRSSDSYSWAFQALGYEASVIDTTTQEGMRHLSEAMQSGEVAFCYGLQGIGSHLLCNNNQSLWSVFSVPFIGLHFDNPCYNHHNHKNDSPWVANIYHAESFLDIQRRYIGGDQVNISLPFQFVCPPDAGGMNFADRPIKYLFLKTCENVDEFVGYFDSLPPPVRDGVWEIVRMAEGNPNLVLCDLVHALLMHFGYDPSVYRTQFWAVVQSLDYYLRNKRALDLVNWLKMQEGAVIVGRGWDSIDRTHARATFLPSIPLEESNLLYAQTQFVFNTNPYGADIIHERVVAGLMRKCCVITDRNAWWDKNFSAVPALLRLDMGQSLDDQISPFVTDNAAERAATGFEPALQHFGLQDNPAEIIACAERTRLHARAAKHSAFLSN